MYVYKTNTLIERTTVITDYYWLHPVYCDPTNNVDKRQAGHQQHTTTGNNSINNNNTRIVRT